MARDQKPTLINVKTVEYRRHEKAGKPPSLLVEYSNGLSTAREWICLEHSGYAREKAVKWWAKRAPGLEIPKTVDEAIDHFDFLSQPTAVKIRKAGKYTEIVGYEFA